MQLAAMRSTAKAFFPELKLICMFISERVFVLCLSALGMGTLLWPEVTTVGLRDRKINTGFVAIAA
jgi:hypothetical protein